MVRFLCALPSALFLLSAILPVAALAQGGLSDVVARSQEAVVRLQVHYFRKDSSETAHVAEGTAFFISPDGYALTAAHVLSDEKQYARHEVRICRPEQDSICDIHAKIVESDPQRDLALLQTTGFRAWPYLPIGSSNEITKPGQFLYIGFANGMQTFNSLLVTSLRDEGLWRAELSTSPGSSGSPVLDDRGCVYGLVVQGLTHQTRILPSGRFLALVDNLVPATGRQLCRRLASDPSQRPMTASHNDKTGKIESPDLPAGILSADQKADLRRLLDVAAGQLIYHRGGFAKNISYAGREYLGSGLFFYPEQHRRLHSKLPQSERAAVAARYDEIKEEVFTRYPELNSSTYAKVAAAFGEAAQQTR